MRNDKSKEKIKNFGFVFSMYFLLPKMIEEKSKNFFYKIWEFHIILYTLKMVKEKSKEQIKIGI